MSIFQRGSEVAGVVMAAAAVALGGGTAIADAADGGVGKGSLALSVASVGGMVSEQTGLVGFDVPLGTVAGATDSSVALSARYSQNLAGSERSGLGAGWSLGLPFVDVEAGALTLGDGRSFVWDASAESGLRDYRLKDVRFERAAVRSPGGAEFPDGRDAAYVLHDEKSGSVQFFDAKGDLLAMQDRFGHVFEFVYQIIGDEHRLQRVVGPWGAAALSWTPSRITVGLPKRSDQQEPAQVVIERSAGRVASITDAAGDITRIEWAPVLGGSDLVLPAAVVSPLGARTEFAYKQYAPRSGGVWAVSRVRVLDAGTDDALIESTEIELDPRGDGRNYTGCPAYCPSGGQDALAQSGDEDYTYVTRVRQGDREVWRTYSNLHQLVKEQIKVRNGGTWEVAQTTDYEYEEGTTARLRDAPATYQLPVESTMSVPNGDPVTGKMEWNDLGLQVEETVGGLQTTTEYGPNSQPVLVETRDLETGERKVVENELTSDGTTVQRSVAKAAEPGGELEVVSTTEYEYQDDARLAGEAARVTVTGAPNAPGGDPGAQVTETATSIDESAGVRRDVVTGPDGVATTTVSDLATGVVLSTSVPGAGETKVHYDDALRQTKVEGPDGVIETSYATTSDGAVVTETRMEDGLSHQTRTDELGREEEVRDNYRPSTGEIGEWRTLKRSRYGTDGTLAATVDVGGREAVYKHDKMGRTTAVVGPDGSEQRIDHNDAQRTTTTAFVPAGASSAAQTTVETVNENGVPIKTVTSFGDGSPARVSQSEVTAFGQPVRTSGSDPFVVDHEFGVDGAPRADRLTPAEGADGTPAVASYRPDAFGVNQTKRLAADGEEVESLTQEINAAGQLLSLTDPTGAETRFEYDTETGQLKSTTNTDGTVDHSTYDAKGQLDETWITTADGRKHHLKREYHLSGELKAIWRVGDRAGSEVAYERNPDGSVARVRYPDGKWVGYTYNDDSTVATMTDPTGATTDFSYDQQTGRLEGATQRREGRVLAEVSYAWDGAGKLKGITRHGGRGASSTFEYDDAGHLVSESHRRAGGANLEQHDYTYTESDKVRTDVATIDGETVTTTYKYTPQGHLLQSRRTDESGKVIEQRDYGVDLASNVSQVIFAAPDQAQLVSKFVHDDANRTTTVTVDGEERTQAYDARGNLVQAADGTLFEYNEANQLTSTRTPDGVEIDYTYYVTGERASETTTVPVPVDEEEEEAHASANEASGSEDDDGPAAADSDAAASDDTASSPDDAAEGEGQQEAEQQQAEVQTRTDTITFYYGADGQMVAERDQNGATATYLIGLTHEARTVAGSTADDGTTYYLTNRRGDKVARTSPDGEIVSRTTYTDYGESTTVYTGDGALASAAHSGTDADADDDAQGGTGQEPDSPEAPDAPNGDDADQHQDPSQEGDTSEEGDTSQEGDTSRAGTSSPRTSPSPSQAPSGPASGRD